MKVVLTKGQKWHDDIREKIQALGYEIIDHGLETEPFTDEEYGCDVLVGLDPFKGADIDKFTNLKLFQATSAGFENLPVDRLREKGIVFANARDVYSVPIAEFTVMRILEIYKKAMKFRKQQSEHIWEKDFRLQEITDKRAAILGTGSIGMQIAKRLKAFDAVTIGFNRSGKSAEYFDEIHEIDEFSDMVSGLDIIVVALPLNDGSVHIINRDILEKMHKKSILINVGRGQSVDTKALYNVLKNESIMGAALDVYEEEPLPEDNPLWDLDNLIFSPHTCSGSNYMNKRVYELTYANLKALAESGEFINRIV
ncbi:MAG: NAD(P)-binding domain-containing protein [Clostridiales bacterium]|nr:NAD(P)-binding domain-containing protein [Clostridiales bacterium]